jgi:hypothetical protein
MTAGLNEFPFKPGLYKVVDLKCTEKSCVFYDFTPKCGEYAGSIGMQENDNEIIMACPDYCNGGKTFKKKVVWVRK